MNIRAWVVRFAPFYIAGMCLTGSALAGPQRDAVCQGSCGGGCGLCPVRDSVDAETRADLRRQAQVAKQEAYDKETWATYHAGVACYNRSDFACAMSKFQLAMSRSPKGTQGYQKFLEAYKSAQSMVKADEVTARQKQDGIDQTNAAAAIRSRLSDMVREEKISPDFEADKAKATAKLAFINTSSGTSRDASAIVDMRGAAWSETSLPIPPELRLSSGFDAYRKGLSLLASSGYERHDWAAVLAWWQTAVLADPNNPFLHKGVEFAEFMKARNAAPAPPAAMQLVLPTRQDIELLGVLGGISTRSSGVSCHDNHCPEIDAVLSRRFPELPGRGTPEERRWAALDKIIEEALLESTLAVAARSIDENELRKAAHVLSANSQPAKEPKN